MSLDNDFQEMVQRYAEGRSSASEVESLCEMLRSDADARRDFVRLMNLEVALESVAAEWAAANAPLSLTVAAPRRRVLIRKPYLLALAACLCLLCVHFWRESVQNQIFATVENGTGVHELPDGTELRNEWLEIAGGTVKLITPNKARLVIEAPATFRFDSRQTITLTRGRLAADIPPSARKFTVITPSGEAVDLGTKFGVDVPLRSEAEIHVFQGEVVAQSSHGGNRRHLYTGEAFQLKSGAGSERKLRSAAFIRPEEVDSLHAALWAGQPARSQEALQKLKQDPSLISLLDFESQELPQGAFDTVQGRWPSSRSAEFVGAADHIRLDLETTANWNQLTMAAWVRLNQFEQFQQSLLCASSAKEAGVSEFSWMMADQKTLQLVVGDIVLTARPPKGKVKRTPSNLIGEEGRWIHLVAIYDGPHQQVRFYVNGKHEGVAEFKDAHPLQFNRLELGHVAASDRKLSGRVDEFLLLGRVMNDAEVFDLYSAGNPYH